MIYDIHTNKEKRESKYIASFASHGCECVTIHFGNNMDSSRLACYTTTYVLIYGNMMVTKPEVTIVKSKHEEDNYRKFVVFL